MKSVYFSYKAENDLEIIGDYIAEDNMCRAVTFIQELRQRCENLSQFPEGQPRFPELGPDAHYCVHGRYLILYRVLTDQVSIERILHGARNIINLIAEDQ